MPEYKLTPSEIKARDRASKQKPKKVPGGAHLAGAAARGASGGQHAARCPACLGSGIMQQSKEQQVDGILFGRSTF